MRLYALIMRLYILLRGFIKKVGDFFNTNFGTALAAAIIALVVQDCRDKAAERESDKNKLIYLNFLINDVYRIVYAFEQQANAYEKSYTNDPLAIPRTYKYPNHSLEEIALRLKQEEYYLASVHQLKSKDITEALRSCNTLYQGFSFAADSYSTGISKLTQDEIALEDSVRQLIEAMNQLVLTAKVTKLTAKKNSVYNQIRDLLIKNEISKRQSYILKNIELDLIDKVIEIVEGRGRESHNILIKAYNAKHQYVTCVRRSNSIKKSVTHNKNVMKKIVKNIKTSSTSLRRFVEENQID